MNLHRKIVVYGSFQTKWSVHSGGGCIRILSETLWRIRPGPVPIFCSIHRWIQHSKRVSLAMEALPPLGFRSFLDFNIAFVLRVLKTRSLRRSNRSRLSSRYFAAATQHETLYGFSAKGWAGAEDSPPLPMIPFFKKLQGRSSRHHKGREPEASILHLQEVWRSRRHQGPTMSFSFPVPLTMAEKRASSPSVSGDAKQTYQPGGNSLLLSLSL